VGPNLTDDQYLRINALVDFVPIIRDGIPEKGMTAGAINGLKTQADIIRMAAYVATLRGTTPATPKAAEGEVIPAWPSHE
jgi:cytochrome c oxidase cbb3-type subunit 3